MKFCTPIIFLLLIAVTTASGGCSFVAGSNVEVIERSRESAPEWCEKIEKEGFETKEAFAVVLARSHVPNISLGAKESQLAAISAGEVAIGDRAKKDLLKYATEFSIKITSQDAFNSIIHRQVNVVSEKSISIADLYYEKIRDPSNADLPEYFRVFVRAELSKEHYQDLLKQLALELKKSRAKDLKRLGDKILPKPGSPLKLIGH